MQVSGVIFSRCASAGDHVLGRVRAYVHLSVTRPSSYSFTSYFLNNNCRPAVYMKVGSVSS